MATTQKTFLLFREQLWCGVPKRTTSIHVVHNVSNDDVLGTIKWRSGWRRYVFYPNSHTVFDAACLQEIVVFITNLMLERDPAKKYNSTFGDERICRCTHEYRRHFDWGDDYRVGCKYCDCMHFKEAIL
jgi:hypothetical protein